MRNGFRLLVFDWDGTLMDSVGAIVACTQHAIRDLGLADCPEERVRRAIGLGLDESLAIFFPDFDPCSGAQLGRQVATRYRELWLEIYKDRPALFPGAAEAIAALAAAGYLLGVATAKSRRGLVRELDKTGLASTFHASRTMDECPAKPHPGMLLELMDELGARPESTLMIGDTAWDLGMARNASTAAVGVLSGSHSRAELESAAPLACLTSVRELPAWLAERSPAAAASSIQP
jgi:phosphoglycolate phosphatase